MSGRYMQFSPSAVSSPQLASMRQSSTSAVEQEKYLSELLAERQKLGPFMEVLPHCGRLLNQEIVRVTSLVGKASFFGHDGLQHVSSLASGSLFSNGGGVDLNGWSTLQSERLGLSQASGMSWHGAPGLVASPVIKKTLLLEVPVDKFPSFNFVGRLLGPRGNSLKRVESLTGCRVFIRGRGSIKDPDKEEKMRGKPGYEHLNDPLHIVIEAEAPSSAVDGRIRQAQEILEDLLKPVDETQDFIKKQQLRELAMLNGTLREDPQYLGTTGSPFNSSGSFDSNMEFHYTK
eukprot:c24900_g2_i3 orf=516-1382(-)